MRDIRQPLRHTRGVVVVPTETLAERVSMLFGFLVSVIVCGCVVVFSLPPACWRAVRQNCRRLDGSWSRNRFRREVAAFGQYLAAIVAPGLLAFLTVFIAATYLFSYVIPLDLAVASLSHVDLDTASAVEELKDVRQKHSGFLREQGLNAAQIHDIQRALWYEWPLIATTAAVLAIGSAYFLIRGAAVAVVTLAAGIRKRRRLYARGDVAKMKCDVPSI